MESGFEAQPDNIDPNDRELVEKLAKLQDMYQQIVELRSLLPDRLVNPARAALENPGHYPPEKVAIQLKDAAVSGSQQIKAFKKDFNNESMKELWQQVSSSEFPQGQDGWTQDYQLLLKQFQQVGGDSLNPDFKQELGTYEIEPNNEEVIARFRDRFPKIQIEFSGDSKDLPIEITLPVAIFTVSKLASTESTNHFISTKARGSDASLSESILRILKEKHNDEKLSDLLTLIASYETVKTQPCDLCHQVFDTSLQLPLLRQRKNGKTTDMESTWKALHQRCADSVQRA